jgi:hypothetical protein
MAEPISHCRGHAKERDKLPLNLCLSGLRPHTRNLPQTQAAPCLLIANDVVATKPEVLVERGISVVRFHASVRVQHRCASST